MAAINVEYIVKLKDRFSTVVKKINNSIQTLDNRLSILNNTYAKLGAAIASIGFGSEIIKATSDFEKFKAVLTNTFGNVDEATQSMEMLKNIAKSTPFELTEITESFIKLVNRGFKPTEKQIIALGDLAASQGKSFDQLAEAVLDAETLEFERLKEFGIKASKQGDKVMFTFKGVTTEVEANGEAIRNYLISLGQMQGVAGSMAAVSQTLEGRISNLKDAYTQLALAIGQELSPVIKNVLNKAIDLINNNIEKVRKKVHQLVQFGQKVYNFIQAHSELIKKLATAFLIGAGAIKTMAMAQRILNAVMKASPIGLLISLIGGLVLILIDLFKTNEKIRESFLNLFKSGSFLQELFSILTSAFNQIKDSFKPILNSLKSLISAILPIILKILGALIPIIITLIEASLPIIEEILPLIANLLTIITPIITDFLNNVLLPLIKMVLPVLVSLLKIILPLSAKVFSFILKIVNTLINSKFGQYLIEAILTPIKLILKGLDWLFEKLQKILNLREKPNRKNNWDRLAQMKRVANTEGFQTALETSNNLTTQTPSIGGTPTGGSGSQITNVSGKQSGNVLKITIEKLVESINIYTTNLTQSKEEIKHFIVDTLTEATNDVVLITNR